VEDKQSYRRIKRRENAIIPLENMLDCAFSGAQWRLEYGTDGCFVLDNTTQWNDANVMFRNYLVPYCLSICNAGNGNISAYNLINGSKFQPLWMELRFQFTIDRTGWANWVDSNVNEPAVTYRIFVFQWKPYVYYNFGDFNQGLSTSVLPNDLFFQSFVIPLQVGFGLLDFVNPVYRDSIHVLMDEYFTFNIGNSKETTNSIGAFTLVPPALPAGGATTNTSNTSMGKRGGETAHLGPYVRRMNLDFLDEVQLFTVPDGGGLFENRTAQLVNQSWTSTVIQQNGIYMMYCKDNADFSGLDLELRSRMSVTDRS